MNGQQLENYKQMIKAVRSDSSSSDKPSSKSDKTNKGASSDDADDVNRNQARHTNSSMQLGRSAKSLSKASSKSPKHARTRDSNYHANRQTPKGVKLSHMGDSGQEETEDFSLYEKLADENRQKELQTTTKARRQGQFAKKGKPPI